MFDDRLKKLRLARGLSQAQVAEQLGLAQKTYCNYERNEREPSSMTLLSIARYFGVTLDYLLDYHNLVEKQITKNVDTLSSHEVAVIKAYRDNLDMQSAVDRLLGVKTPNVKVYKAARSSDNHEPEIVKMSGEQISGIQNAEETDEDL